MKKKIIFLKNGVPKLIEISGTKDEKLVELIGTEDFEYVTLEFSENGKGYYAIIDSVGRVKGLEEECIINYGNGFTDLCGPVAIVKMDEYAEEEGRIPDTSFLDEAEMFKALEHLEWEPFR